jgi:hypothetical protein
MIYPKTPSGTATWHNGYVIDINAFNEGSPIEAFAHGTCKVQLQGYNIDENNNTIESSDGHTDRNPPWGVTSQFTV